nr:uncharacterized protein LOC107377055 isoform X1 [Nothobranchius furzeri]XP_054603475.1 uncharacterized protein LOC107377055 isoform X1 [Nothobranchius furzeri]
MEFHQLDEQFKLVKNDFTRVGGAFSARGNTDTVILTGPSRFRGAKPVGLHTNVLRKRVHLPQDLLTFIKSKNAILKYETLFQQRFSHPIFIEVGSELMLSSLCPRDLDEALEVVVGDLCVRVEKLHGAAALPPDVDKIKELLIKAKTDANRDEVRVDVIFIPGQNTATVTKVRLVGYTEHVNKLTAVLLDYQLNQVLTEQVVNLPHPELVTYFDKILDMIGMKQTKVTLKPLLYPHSCVAVSGPRCHFVEVHQHLTSVLGGLTFDHLVFNGPGAQRFFEADGKERKEQIESSCKVLIREKHGSRSHTLQQSAFFLVGLLRKNVDDATTQMKNLYQNNSSTKTFTKEDLADLTQDDMKEVKLLAEIEGLYLQEGQPSPGGLMVSGLKAGVNQVALKLQTTIPLRRLLRIKEEDGLYPRVSWCILGLNGCWERLPKTANYRLEKCDATKGIVDTQGVAWSVNLQRMEATEHIVGGTAKLKRLENLQDFTLPLYWDSMGENEYFQEFLLEPSSAEYHTVQKAFNKTAQKMVVKIVRLQNIHLRRVYEMQKKNISEKNQQDGAGEKLLYHGTSQETCTAIKTKGFNRSFSGKMQQHLVMGPTLL